MKKSIVYTILFLVLTTGLAILLGSAAKNNAHTPACGFRVIVHSHSGNHFIGPGHLEQGIVEAFDSIAGRKISPEMLKGICLYVHGNPYVANANVYRTINGTVTVDATLHDPLVRIIDTSNQSYYIGKDGRMFPLANDYTARVQVASGNINPLFHAGADVFCPDAAEDNPGLRVLQDIYELASHIRTDPFWDAIIDHIVSVPGNRFELIPKNGMHVIAFGEARDIHKKFEKLRTFYKHGLTKAGWYEYRRINVEFAQQVICSR